jgi:DNA-directed RNA polymerase subunit RPC12/RpoP
METVEEHQERRRREINEMVNNAQRTGIRCPDCSIEMINRDGAILTSNPPQMNVTCPFCGYKTTVLA